MPEGARSARDGILESAITCRATAATRVRTPGRADALRALGAPGPAGALDNGLDDAENRELFHATDSHRIVERILTGLSRRFPAP